RPGRGRHGARPHRRQGGLRPVPAPPPGPAGQAWLILPDEAIGMTGKRARRPGVDADSAVRELRQVAGRSFGDAVALPPGVYTSERFLELETEHIFKKEWICVGRASALPQPGAYLTSEIAGQPVFVIRDQQSRVRAFSNVCLHRMSTLLEGQGAVKVIV